jgi:uncharacterized protein YjgD (DUF1641 family)
MIDALVITPVKDSIQTTLKTIESISTSEGKFEFIIFNDFSNAETKSSLETNSRIYNYELVNIEDYTTNPPPNYRLILQLAQQKALQKEIPLIIVESDVIVTKNILKELISISESNSKSGLVGAITVNEKNEYNFPYTFEKKKSTEVVNAKHSMSFCCTLITVPLLMKFSFKNLPEKKDWFDVHISRQSKKYGFVNLLAKNLEVFHQPHSSRPWKKLKYENPVLYYLEKYLKKRDRI